MASVIKSKPYGYHITNASVGTVTNDLVEVSTVIYIPYAGTTTESITLTDIRGDVFWNCPANVTLTGPITDYFTNGMRVEGIKISTCSASETNCTIIIKTA